MSFAHARLEPQRFAPGMALQLERFRQALADGMPRRGWKIGINVPEVLRQLDLPHPGVGWIDGGRVLESGAALEAPPEARLHAEPELAIRVASALAPNATAADARRCIGALHPALELVSYARPGAGLDQLIAHCMFHAATVLGPACAPDLPAALGRDRPLLRAGARTAQPPRSDLVPDDPGALLLFVARFLGAFGEALAPGDLVLSGSYTARALALTPGDELVADFGALGRVSASVR